MPVGGGSDCDWSGGRDVGCWADALPDSTANPTAAMADNLRVFIVLLPYLEDFRAHSAQTAVVISVTLASVVA